MGSGCFLDDPADDGWGQMCRLGVIKSMSNRLRHAGKAGRGELGLILTCKYDSCDFSVISHS